MLGVSDTVRTPYDRLHQGVMTVITPTWSHGIMFKLCSAHQSWCRAEFDTLPISRPSVCSHCCCRRACICLKVERPMSDKSCGILPRLPASVGTVLKTCPTYEAAKRKTLCAKSRVSSSVKRALRVLRLGSFSEPF